MEAQTQTRVWKLTLINRLLSLVAALAFIVVGAWLITIAAGGTESMSDSVVAAVIGALCILFFGWSFVQTIQAERVTLIADSQGVNPVFLPAEYEGIIPWSDITDIKIIEQKMKHAKVQHLAIYLSSNRSFGPLFSGTEHGLTGLVAGTMPDAGAASLYIPGKRINEKLESVRDTLLAMRSQYTNNP